MGSNMQQQEEISRVDRERINAMVTVLRGQYEERLKTATHEFNAAQHELNWVGHEMTRLEKHL